MKKKYKAPRPMSIVQLADTVKVETLSGWGFIFYPGRSYLFLGEILNKPGCCAVVDCNRTQNAYVGYPTNIFVEIEQEDGR